MTTSVPLIVTALALGAAQHTRQRLAVDMVLLGTKLRAERLENYWRWSVWLAAGITIRRIHDSDE